MSNNNRQPKHMSVDQSADVYADVGVEATPSGGDLTQVSQLLKVGEILGKATDANNKFHSLAGFVNEEVKYMVLAAQMLNPDSKEADAKTKGARALLKERIGYGLEGITKLAQLIKDEHDRLEMKEIFKNIGVNDVAWGKLSSRKGLFS